MSLPHALLQGRLCGCGLKFAMHKRVHACMGGRPVMFTCLSKLTPYLRILASAVLTTRCGGRPWRCAIDNESGGVKIRGDPKQDVALSAMTLGHRFETRRGSRTRIQQTFLNCMPKR
jgi:hypothetical protein